MPPRPAARASPVTSAIRTAASGWVSGPRQHVEGEREQAVAGEDRGRLVEFLVRGRPAAAQVVVVHRRQVVVHQRIAMHQLDRGAGHQRLLALDAEQRRGLDRQKRPQPLAAAEARVAHGLDDAMRPRDLVLDRGSGEKAVQQLLGLGGGGVEPAGERGVRAGFGFGGRGDGLTWDELCLTRRQ